MQLVNRMEKIMSHTDGNDQSCDPYIWISRRLSEIMEWDRFMKTLWWIEGKKRLGSKKTGDRRFIWIPLYSATSEAEGMGVLRAVLNANSKDSKKKVANATGDAKKDAVHGLKEITMLEREFLDFRLVEPVAQVKPKRTSAKALPDRYNPIEVPHERELSVVCPNCKSEAMKKVKKGETKLWRCLDCNRRWARSSGEAPTRPAKPLKDQDAVILPLSDSEKPRKAHKRNKKNKERVPSE